MKEKDKYTLQELYDNLEIGLSELGRIGNVSEVTVARIRDGYDARRSTINRLLRAFSQVYGREISFENVTGIRLQTTTKARSIPASAALSLEPETPQNRTVERKREDIPDDLPEGTIRLIDFVEKHHLPESSMSRWVNTGVKKGEKIPTTARPKASGMGMQHFLTPTQQSEALEILARHGKLKEVSEESSDPAA